MSFSVDLFCVAKIRCADGTERDGQSLQRCCCLYIYTYIYIYIFLLFSKLFFCIFAARHFEQRSRASWTCRCLCRCRRRCLTLEELTAILRMYLCPVSVSERLLYPQRGICICVSVSGSANRVCVLLLEGFRFQTSNLRISSAAYKIVYLFLVRRRLPANLVASRLLFFVSLALSRFFSVSFRIIPSVSPVPLRIAFNSMELSEN